MREKIERRKPRQPLMVKGGASHQNIPAAGTVKGHPSRQTGKRSQNANRPRWCGGGNSWSANQALASRTYISTKKFSTITTKRPDTSRLRQDKRVPKRDGTETASNSASEEPIVQQDVSDHPSSTELLQTNNAQAESQQAHAEREPLRRSGSHQPSPKLKLNVDVQTTDGVDPDPSVPNTDHRPATGMDQANLGEDGGSEYAKSYCLRCHSQGHEDFDCGEEISAGEATEINLWFKRNVPSIYSLWQPSLVYKGESDKGSREAFHRSVPVTFVDLLDHLYYLVVGIWRPLSTFVVERDWLIRGLEMDEELIKKVHGPTGSTSEGYSLWRRNFTCAIRALNEFLHDVSQRLTHLIDEVIEPEIQWIKSLRVGWIQSELDHLRTCYGTLRSSDKILNPQHQAILKDFHLSLDQALFDYEKRLDTIEEEQLGYIVGQTLDHVQLRILRLSTWHMRLRQVNDPHSVFIHFKALSVPQIAEVASETFHLPQDDLFKPLSQPKVFVLDNGKFLIGNLSSLLEV